MTVSTKEWSKRPVILFVLLVFVIIASGCTQEEQTQQPEVIRPVKFFEVGGAGKGLTFEYSGEIKAAQEVDMSFEVPGKIIEFPVTEGQRVKKGDFLARVDPRDYQTMLDSARADLNAAVAEYDRARDLYENNTISKRDLDVARRNFEKAKADTTSARKTMEDTRIVAPFDGVVARTVADKFQNIQAKEIILSIHDNSSLEMKVDIPEQDFTKHKKKSSLDKMTDSLKPELIISSLPGRRFQARFKEASTIADPVTRTFEVTFGFTPPSDITIFPGMTARLMITAAMEADTDILIPAKAVFSDDKKQAMVWKIHGETKKTTSVPVVVGDMSESDIYIKKGLKKGDIIAVSGVHQLRDGMTVRQYQ
jgi:RND family efflux transporter MFP subunit